MLLATPMMSVIAPILLIQQQLLVKPLRVRIEEDVYSNCKSSDWFKTCFQLNHPNCTVLDDR